MHALYKRQQKTSTSVTSNEVCSFVTSADSAASFVTLSARNSMDEVKKKMITVRSDILYEGKRAQNSSCSHMTLVGRSILIPYFSCFVEKQTSTFKPSLQENSKKLVEH